MEELRELRQIIRDARRIVFFGGAGVSTDSGIPDFRGNGGLYQTDETFDERPETILSHGYLFSKPQKFYDYYKKYMIYPNAKPNDAHRILAELERAGKLTAVITQNIDGLHQAAGSKNVIELHGSVLRNYCVNCGKAHSLSYVMQADGVPYCESCGGLVRPDVVLYGEGLDEASFLRAEREIARADVMIVGGTSLTVHPAASLVGLYEGEHLVIINKSMTPYDRYADYVINDSLSDVLKQLVH
jgi:NAD-dependent deacetylase